MIHYTSISSLDEMVSITRENTDDLGLKIIKEFIETLDLMYKKGASRKTEWVVQSNDMEKRIKTEMGYLEYKRTYYKSKNYKDFAYLVDDLLDIEPHQKLDKGLQDKIIETATDISYHKTGLSCSREPVSKNTVKSIIHNTFKVVKQLCIGSLINLEVFVDDFT
jgi:hypothetical protein